MKTLQLTNYNGIKIPFNDMAKMSQDGLLILNFTNDAQLFKAMKVDNAKGFEVVKKNLTISLFLLTLFVGFYLSLLLAWWSILIAIVISVFIKNIGNKLLTKKYLKQAIFNKEFYENLLYLNCLCYEINPADENHFEKYKPKASNHDIIGAFGDLMQKEDFEMYDIYDVKELSYSKEDTLRAFCEEIKNTHDEKMRGLLETGLSITCHFFEDIGKPLRGFDSNTNNEMLNLFKDVKTVEDASKIDKEKLLELVKNREPIDKEKYNKYSKQAVDDFNAIADKIGINKI